ncbi:hypothetical protein KDA23_04215 [Candidatus Saccharibacteria bacterium]|nr:hypothetical protein [Candidatus Saccharibacteria bacterium]
MAVILTILAVLAVLLVNEWWWHKKTHGEISRKFVHLTVGTFVAFWPLYLSWREIELLSLAFVVVVIISQRLHLFRAIHSVTRPTVGEIFFGVSVGLIAFVAHDAAIYSIALLHMALADGLAAIVGVKYGASRAYIVFGSRKSVAGSVTFMVVSAALVTVFALQQGIGFSLILPAVVIAATLTENVAVHGLDNLLVPVLVAAGLNLL